MDHIEAVKIMAAERYLLRELSSEEIDAFEDHYFDCSECTQAVLDGTLVLDGGRSLVRQERRRRQPGALRWIPLVAAGLFGAVALVTTPMAMRVPALVAQVNSYAAAEPGANVLGSIRESSRIDFEVPRGTVSEIAVKAGSVQTFSLPYNSSYEQYRQFRAEVRDSTGKVRGTEIVSAEETLTLAPLRRGHYVLTIDGVRADGTKTQLRKTSFVVQ
jgi:hypothetical protein